jgi:enoyl-CoA hydratase
VTDDLSVTRLGSVAEVVLNGPRGNALTPARASELARILTELGADPQVGAVVLVSKSRNFCTGADTGMLSDLLSDPLRAENFDGLGQIYQLFGVLAGLPVPTIAAVAGNVIGAGINLALACDLRVAGESLRLRGFAVARLHPGGGHLKLLLDRLTPSAAAAVALFDQEISADQAVNTGFAWSCVPDDQLRAAALDLAAAAAQDIELGRRVTATYRAVRASQLSAEAAVLAERAPQVWSLRRLAGTDRSRSLLASSPEQRDPRPVS